jgi:DNA-binding transcriptional regulator YdaS (Cro superfamily)
MLTLSQFLDTNGAPSLTDLAEKIGISKGRLSQLKSETDWPPDIALKIEAATHGAIDASAMSTIIQRARKDAA